MKIKDPIAREYVVVVLKDGSEIDTERTPEELLFILSKGETVKDLDHNELTKAFVAGCEKDLMMAFVQNYDFWFGRYQSGYWDKEMFEKRLGKTKDRPFRRITEGEEMWETLKKFATKKE